MSDDQSNSDVSALELREMRRPSAEEALRLSRAFYRVKSPETRAEIIAIVERHAAES